jgi:hypothetical protein
MPHGCQLTGNEMRTGTGLHYHGTRRKVAEEPHHLLTREFLAKHRPAWLVLAVQMKAVFAEITPTIANSLMMMASECRTPG